MRDRNYDLLSLQALRAVAALLVVMYHTELIFGAKAALRPFGGIFRDGNRGVDLFFVLSGFIITYIHAADWDKPKRAANYVYNRLSRIYPSVVIMTLLAVGVYAAGFVGIDRAVKLTPWNVIASALLLPQKDVALVNVTWTLKYEMFFYLIFAILILQRKAGVVVLAVWQAVLLFIAISRIPYENLWGGFYLRPICLEFGIGIVCALVFMRKRLWRHLPPALLWATFFAGCAVFVSGALLEAFPVDGAAGLALPEFLVFGVSSGFMILSLVMLESAGRLRVTPLLAKLGDASYAIYLVHFSVISLLVVAATRSHRIPMNDATCLVVAAIAVAVGIAFDQYIDRPLQKLLRRMKPGVLALVSS
jgi:exopolysaccharide production protein ExoZ